MRKNSLLTWVVMGAVSFAVAGCGASREVEVAGEVSAPADVRAEGAILVELAEEQLNGLETPDDRLLVLAPDEGDQLLSEQSNVLRECIDLLERAVVEIESEANEQPFVGRSQSRLVVLGSRAGVVVVPGDFHDGGYAGSAVRVATRPA